MLSTDTERSLMTSAVEPRLPAATSRAAPWDIADYSAVLRKLQARGDVVFITYDDLEWGDDDGRDGKYLGEWKRWKRRLARDPAAAAKVHLLLQHDTDSGPAQSLAMAELEAHMGVRSSIMSFVRWPRVSGGATRVEDYPLDWQRLHMLRQRGFTIGYHCNALHLCAYDERGVYEAFDRDIELLAEKGFDIRFFSAHGGARSPVTGAGNNAFDYPGRCRHRPLWVHNGRSPRFDGAFSDGGELSRSTHGERAELERFVDGLVRGRRYRILIHPQYYDCARVPLLCAQPYVPPAVVAPLQQPMASPSTPGALGAGAAASMRRWARGLFSHWALYQRLTRLRRAPAEVAALRQEVARQREQLARLQAELEAQRTKTRELYQRNKDYAARLRGQAAPAPAAAPAKGKDRD